MDILQPWLAVAVVMITLGGIGRCVAPAATGFGPLWWGWGLGALLMTLYATFTPWPLTPFLMGCALLAAIGYARYQPSRSEFRDAGLLALLALPLLWAWSHNEVFMWDDFAHRLPSLLFVDMFDSFPRHDLPPNLSHFPSYPYALTILGLGVNRLLGEYTDLSIAMVNGALLVAFAGMFVRALIPHKPAISATHVLAFGLAIAILANPIFKAVFVASAYQESPLALSMAVAFLLMRPFLNGTRTPTIQEALSIGLVLALVTGLKQVGIVLAMLLALPFLALSTHRLATNKRHMALLTIPLLSPAFAIWLAWRHYVAVNIGGGEFAFLPWEQWHWDLWPQMLASLGKVTIQKPMVVLPLLATSWLTYHAFRNSRLADQRYSLLAAITTGWGYVAFLMLSYIGSFGDYEAARLASFSRYMQHVNWMLWAAFVFAMQPYAMAWLHRYPNLRHVPLALLLIPAVVPHMYVGKANAEARQMKALAAYLPTLLPANQNLTIRLDEPEGSGYRTHVLQYYAGYSYRIIQGITTFGPGDRSVSPSAIIQAAKPDEPLQFSRCTPQCEPSQTVTLP